MLMSSWSVGSLSGAFSATSGVGGRFTDAFGFLMFHKTNKQTKNKQTNEKQTQLRVMLKAYEDRNFYFILIRKKRV